MGLANVVGACYSGIRWLVMYCCGTRAKAKAWANRLSWAGAVVVVLGTLVTPYFVLVYRQVGLTEAMQPIGD